MKTIKFLIAPIFCALFMATACAPEKTEKRNQAQTVELKSSPSNKVISTTTNNATKAASVKNQTESKADIPLTKPDQSSDKECDEIVLAFEKVIKSLNAGEEKAIENLEKIMQNPLYSKCNSIAKYADKLKELDKMIK